MWLALRRSSRRGLAALAGRAVVKSVAPRRFCALSDAPPILASLEPAQRAAVEHAGSPLMVVAGPGTGKTHVIAARAVHLVRAQGIRASRVLVLTFSDKAAAALEARVDVNSAYGASDCHTRTFHAFGRELLQEFGLEAGLSTSFRVMSAAQTALFLEEHIGALGLRRLAPAGPPDALVRALAEFFSRMQDAGVTPAAYEEWAAGRRPADDDDARRHAELSRAYARFDAKKAAHAALDFPDLVSRAARLLRERPAVAADVAARFDAVLVDEFQDVNPAMFDLVSALVAAREGLADRLAVVGDDDQAIFAFRGAGPENFRRFAEAFPSARVVPLTASFRSYQTLLDSARRLIRHNPGRLEDTLGLSKRLVSKCLSPPPHAPRVQHLRFRTGVEEVAGIAARARDLCRDLGVPAHRVAVLVRSNWDVPAVVAGLTHHGVRVSFSGGGRLHSQPEVRMAVAFLSAVTQPGNSSALYDLLLSDAYRARPAAVVRLAEAANRAGRTLREQLRVAVGGARPQERAKPYVLRRSATSLKQPQQAPQQQQQPDPQLAAAARDLDELERMSTETGVRPLLVEFLRRRGLDKAYSGGGDGDGDGDDSPEALAAEARGRNLARLMACLEEYEPALGTDRAAFVVPHLHMLRDVGDDPAADEAGWPDEDAVQVMSVHKAKGLEFDVVFLAGATEDRMPGRNRRPELPVPDELARAPADPSREAHVAEERRLAFVAMTRARQFFFFTSSESAGGGTATRARVRKPSRFVAEALGEDPAAAAAAAASEPKAAAVPAAQERRQRRQQEEGELEPLRLSYSRMDTYLRCPARYCYSYVLEMPSARTVPLVLGSALHAGVAEWARGRGEEAMVEALDAEWDESVFPGGAEEAAAERERAIGIMRAFAERQAAEQEAGGAPVPELVEQRFLYEALPERRVSVLGFWDRVDRTSDGRAVLREFKTKVHPFMRRAVDSNLQLQLYAHAYERVHGEAPERAVLESLTTGERVEYTPRPQDAGVVERTVARVADGIRAHRFGATPSPAQCRLCPYTAVCQDAAVPKGGGAQVRR